MGDASDFRRQMTDAGLRLSTQVRLQQVPSGSLDDALAVAITTEMVEELPSGTVGGAAALYETRVADGHHHVVCRACGANTDIWDGVVGLVPSLDPSTVGGYLIDEAEVTFWGTCPACQASPPAGAAGTKRLTVLAMPAPSPSGAV